MSATVVDQTGTTRVLNWEPSPVDPTLLITAMREQLGLSLKSQKVPVDVLVIDGAEKVAAGN